MKDNTVTTLMFALAFTCLMVARCGTESCGERARAANLDPAKACLFWGLFK